MAVTVCTYNRPGPLAHLLTVLAEAAEREQGQIALAIIVVDDSADQNARDIVKPFADRFELGAIYAHSGARNIAKARNLALETALATGAEWIAMTDDDCEPSPSWLTEMVGVQRKYDADVVTGPLIRRAPAHAPHWLRSQPFLEVTAFRAETGSVMEMAFTNNSMIRGELLRKSPDLRFDPAFGRIGGEDMVFYRAVAQRGFRIVFAAQAKVFENEEEERLTVGYQMRRHLWVGNSSVQTSMQQGASRSRMAVHSVGTLFRAIKRPVSRLGGGQHPQFLYAIAQVIEGLGKLAGTLGIKINHK